MTFDKAVKGATKTKHAPPKAKYIDPIVQGTFEGDYAVSDIAQSIAPRLRDSNSSVVFKALILVHTILRSGNAKSVYGVLSSKPHLLGLNNVTSGHDSVQNLTKYAFYLHTRIKTYSSVGRDPIRDRNERRAEGRGDGGEKLRNLTVEKGLLREVATLQKLLDSLLECKFYLEDKEDEVTMSALRLLVKDLLILFMSVNEGVINVLEHYFEMSHVDATTSLKIYKAFCKQTERVVTYLGVAKKMQNVLQVQVPNLKHAPVSLAGSLEEYIKDSNFEANRLEYKKNREIAEGKPSKPSATSSPPSTPKQSSSTPATNGASSSQPSASASTSAKPAGEGNKAFVDFFEAIEQEQTSMFDPQTGSPNQAYFQQQAAYNPFLRQQMAAPFGPMQPQMTGAMAFGQQPFAMQPQMTGFAAFGGMNAFGQPQQQPQQTGFLQPQATGVNPFRQSVMMPQMTGMNPFGQQQMQAPQPFSPFGNAGPQQQQQQPPPGATSPQQSSVSQLQPQWTGMQAFQRPASTPATGNAAGPANGTAQNTLSAPFGQPQQQASPHPLAPQPTGSKNPFAPPPGSQPAEPPKPPAPSMNAIAFQAFQNMQMQNQQAQQPQQQQTQGQQSQSQQNQPASNGFTGQNQQNGSSFGDLFGSASAQQPKQQLPQQTGLMSSLASDFAFGRAISPSNSNAGQSNGTASGLPSNTTGSLPSFGNASAPSAPSSSNTGTSAPSFSFSGSSGPSSTFGSNSQNTGSSAFSASTFGGSSGQPPQALQSQPTGFGGSSVKPFQPSSSFGTNLFAEQGNKPTSPSPLSQQSNQSQPQQQQQTSNLLGDFGGSSFGQSIGGQQQQPSSLQPQQTGTPNPFRMSMMPGGGTAQPSGGGFTPNFFGNAGTQPQAQQANQGGNTNGSQWGSLI